MPAIPDYGYEDGTANSSHNYLLPAVMKILESDPRRPGRIFDLGCGNGYIAAAIAGAGYLVSGVDPSPSGIAEAKKNYPGLDLCVGDTSMDLAAMFGSFDVVVSLEVVEHVYAPREFAASVYSLLPEGGTAIISTPYHGYLKNVALAVTGQMDQHFHALWDGGHIKFWSRATLRALLQEVGFREVSFERVGRIPPLAKSMIAVAVK